ncbi:MAG TPA: CBS domain-containing protein, partial [Candidatus Altiarchaeales archaeon]|nr:CBS domain-containing protein [Candidatus Altiarchaeales archaeon]
MKVKDIMRRDIIKINSDASVKDAIKRMFDENVTSLIVNSPDDKDIYGIITRKDIVNKIIAYNRDINEVKVRDIMTEPILTISQDIDLMNAASLMAKTDIRRFPV